MVVGVMGAGFQGTCVALELATRGVDVELYDVNPVPITQAGYANEGKIHLGLVYANDPTRRSAEMMIRGALTFGRYLRKWLDGLDLQSLLSSPFHYVVHKGSMVDLDAIRAHFAEVAERAKQIGGDRSDYLGRPLEFVYRELPPRAWRQHFDSGLVEACFWTEERAIDPVRLATALRRAVGRSSRIRFRARTRVSGVFFEDGGVGVRIDGSPQVRMYDHVVNALWGGRMAVDHSIGLTPPRPWIHRFKYGIRIMGADSEGGFPSATIMLGRYGDVVRYTNGDVYVSWYPVCLAGKSTELAPPDWPVNPGPRERRRLFEKSIDALAEICPSLGRLARSDLTKIEVRGGIIVAWGATDISDAESLLHQRHEIGPSSFGTYHTIDTGKYTCAPLFAVEVAERICRAM